MFNSQYNIELNFILPVPDGGYGDGFADGGGDNDGVRDGDSDGGGVGDSCDRGRGRVTIKGSGTAFFLA